MTERIIVIHIQSDPNNVEEKPSRRREDLIEQKSHIISCSAPAHCVDLLNILILRRVVRNSAKMLLLLPPLEGVSDKGQQELAAPTPTTSSSSPAVITDTCYQLLQRRVRGRRTPVQEQQIEGRTDDDSQRTTKRGCNCLTTTTARMGGLGNLRLNKISLYIQCFVLIWATLLGKQPSQVNSF